ncbi:chaperone protein dnaJ 13-like protein [Corchorus olitorius]|uniref:Chaperone protein dnaJ 13-like protein n=1 Tax=Corchorus olitorius TaxID=93759 RepID=A0A1R3KVU8_9ROSI|nr:chaperone protein dnaJ 13-like protein [Corchorus olitorius]
MKQGTHAQSTEYGSEGRIALSERSKVRTSHTDMERQLGAATDRVKYFEESSLFKYFYHWLSASSRGRYGQRTGKSSMELELGWGYCLSKTRSFIGLVPFCGTRNRKKDPLSASPTCESASAPEPIGDRSVHVPRCWRWLFA